MGGSGQADDRRGWRDGQSAGGASLIKAIESAELVAEKLRPAAQTAREELERLALKERDPVRARIAAMSSTDLLSEVGQLERRRRQR